MTFLRSPLRSQTSRLRLDNTTGGVRARRRNAGGSVATAAELSRFVLRLPAQVLLAFIQVYQRTLAPILPVVTLGRCGCRFSPTCSHYAADAIRVHGALTGSFLAAIRLLKCTPLHPGGFDPVPARRQRRRCDRIVA